MDLDCEDFKRAGYMNDDCCCEECHYIKQYSHIVEPPRRRQITRSFVEYHMFHQKHILIADLCCKGANIVKRLKRSDWVKVIKLALKAGKPSRTDF